MSNGNQTAAPVKIQQQGLCECWRWRVRETPPTALEYTAAEFWIREQYVPWFRNQFGIPQIVTWQLARFTEGYTPGDPILELALQVLETDFRNKFSERFTRDYQRLLKSRTATSDDIAALVKRAQPGGALKPDMLGISANRTTLTFDAVEVGTVQTAQSTYDELTKKLGLLQSEVVPRIEMGIPPLRAKYSERRLGISAPTSFAVAASTFRLGAAFHVMPLPLNIGSNGSTSYADWICFHPSKTYSRSGQPTLPSASPGIDGLYVYHIHRAAVPTLPERVKKFVESELRQWKIGQGSRLELNPALAAAMKESERSWAPEAEAAFAYLGAGALLLAFSWVAVEVGLIAAVATVADAAVVGLTESPALYASLRGAADVTARLWPAAASAAPMMPGFAGR